MSDYVVSSYTPTIGSLIEARKHATPPTAEVKVMIVAEPNVEGNAPLPNATAETEMIKEKMASKVVSPTNSCVVSPLRLANILEEMEDASVIHLACHGQQDPKEPLESGFMLQDGRLTVSHILQLKLQKTHFAFLAACESASGDREQPDEAIHLGAAMLFMGVKSIVGTLW
jgi:CHAT domain-containing protein